MIGSATSTKCKNNVIELLSVKEDCVGCGNCIEVCPTKALISSCDEIGFLLPSLDATKCVSCGKCVNMCPAINRKKTISDFKPICAFVGHNKSHDVRKNSSSGGFFNALSRSILDKNGLVCGVIYADNFERVKHTLSDNPKEIAIMQGSKYVQSCKTHIFEQIKTALKEKIVLFTGTPCEIAALKLFLQTDHQNLITCDFVCHGVTSPQHFFEYIKNLKLKYKSEIEFLTMRSKHFGWTKDYLLNCKFKSKKNIFKYLSNTPIGFAFNNLRRKSCYDCPFRIGNRVSDITMGDHWKAFNPLENNQKGISKITINTSKGYDFFKDIKDFHFESYNQNNDFESKNNLSSEQLLRRDTLGKKVAEIGFLRYYEKSLTIKLRLAHLLPANIKYLYLNVKRIIKSWSK